MCQAPCSLAARGSALACSSIEGCYLDGPGASKAQLLSLPKNGGGAEPPLPLEIRQMGSFDVTYRTRLEVNSGELPVLPLSIYGAVAMAHGPESLDGEMSSNAFFLHKFVRSSSGLAGLSFDEGNFSVFGYITDVRPAWAGRAARAGVQGMQRAGACFARCSACELSLLQQCGPP